MISSRAAWVLAAVAAAIWFSALGFRTLVKPDEGRYAEIAREMNASGDWVTPRLNGIKYFEKPPLQYWVTAAAFRVFGENDWTARLWPGMTGFLGVLVAGLLGARLYGAVAGWLAAAVLATSVMYFVVGHLNTLDMGTSFFLESALAAFLLAQGAPPGGRAERGWMLAAWAAMALATLSKGLIGLAFPVLTLVAYSIVERDPRPWRRLHIVPGLALFLAIAAPWFVAVSIANPEFPRFFFVHEHFERFLTTEHHRVQPFWYFAPILLGGLIPWSTIALQGWVEAWRRSVPSLPRDSIRAARFLALWAAVIFVFFSASGSKLPSYILPVIPALAVLAGDALARMPGRVLRWHLGAVVLAGLVGLPWLYGAMPTVQDASALMLVRYANWLMLAIAVCGAAAALAWWRAGERPVQGALALGAGALFLSVTGLLGHEALGRSNSAHYIAGEIGKELLPGAPFYSVGMYDQTLPFYLKRTVTLVDYSDEFEFGLAQEPGRRIDTIAEFEKRWRGDPMAYAVMSDETYRRLQGDRLPMRVLARDVRRVIVAKP
ncbi:MAG TPA: glycosyltransferase family 39 protein [Burkholderiales bacterium]|nr:glycosyltransferase family 39 protein [Burkholderiales bacterium]